MTAVAIWIVIRLGYLIGGIAVLAFAGVLLDRYINRRIARHLQRARDVPYLPIEAARRRHPSNCQRIDAKVSVPRRLG